MRICLLHLSDLHVKEEGNVVSERIEKIGNAIQEYVLGSEHLFIVVAGDIAFSGDKKEYAVAEGLFGRLWGKLKGMNKQLELHYVIVPGNHDCNLRLDSEARRLLINILRSSRGEDAVQDASVIDICTQVQRDFFEWFRSVCREEWNGQPGMYWSREFQLREFVIRFNCLNTAWLTSSAEDHGDIAFPYELLQAPEDGVDLVVSVLHHPYHWMTHEKASQFKKQLEAVSNIILTGHEHEPQLRSQAGRDTQNQYMSGGTLQGAEGSSLFNTLTVDLGEKKQQYSEFSWSNGMYDVREKDGSWETLPLNKALRQGKFTNNIGYQIFLSKAGVPYKHPRKSEGLTLEDIYVFPNLEVRYTTMPKPISVVSSADVPGFVFDERNVLLIGSDDSGKTSLLKMLYLYLGRKGIVPLMVDWREIISLKEEALRAKLREKFTEQYSSAYASDYFVDLGREDRAILIDDVDEVRLGSKGKAALVDKLSKYYDRIIMTSGDIFELEEVIGEDSGPRSVEFRHCVIQEFGELLTYQLIKKWCALEQEYTIDEKELARQLRTVQETVKTILGPNLLPSHPFFILTIIQSCEQNGVMNIPLMKECGAFGYYYEWLITYALSASAKKIPDLGAKYAYLSQLAYMMFKGKQKNLSEAAMGEFHANYCKKHALEPIRDFPFGGMIEDLVSADMLAEENGLYCFQYGAVYYYFVARAIDGMLQDPRTRTEMVSTVKDLTLDICSQVSSCILVFLAYKSRDPVVRNTILESGQDILRGKGLCDLDNDVAFINRLNMLIRTTYVLPSEGTEEVREEHLRRIDEKRARGASEVESSETSAYEEVVLPIRKGFVTVRVLGQIVKNFAREMEGEDKSKVVRECYLLGLRTLKYVLELMESSVEEFLADVRGRIVAEEERQNAEKPEWQRTHRTEAQLQEEANVVAFLYVDLAIFSAVRGIARAVGLESLGPVLEEVRKGLDSLSVRLIDTTVKLEYYRHLPLEEIYAFDDLLQHNPVVHSALKHLVWNRLLLWESDRVERQKICAKLHMPVGDPRLLGGPARRIELQRG